MNALMRYARTWVWRGMREGSRPWLVAGFTAGALEIARRAVTKSPELIYEAELEAGERLEIRTIPGGAENNSEPAR